MFRSIPAALTAVFLLVACQKGWIMNEDKTPSDSSRSYPVTIDTTRYMNVPSAERKRIEEDAIQGILAIVPAEHRQEAEQMLRGTMPGLAAWSIPETNNPELSRLLSIYGSARMAGSAKKE